MQVRISKKAGILLKQIAKANLRSASKMAEQLILAAIALKRK